MKNTNNRIKYKNNGMPDTYYVLLRGNFNFKQSTSTANVTKKKEQQTGENKHLKHNVTHTHNCIIQREIYNSIRFLYKNYTKITFGKRM